MITTATQLVLGYTYLLQDQVVNWLSITVTVTYPTVLVVIDIYTQETSGFNKVDRG